MPKGTRVHRCVEKLTERYGYSGAIGICQKSTRQSYMTGKTLRKKRTYKSKKSSGKHKRNRKRTKRRRKTKRKTRRKR